MLVRRRIRKVVNFSDGSSVGTPNCRLQLIRKGWENMMHTVGLGGWRKACVMALFGCVVFAGAARAAAKGEESENPGVMKSIDSRSATAPDLDGQQLVWPVHGWIGAT